MKIKKEDFEKFISCVIISDKNFYNEEPCWEWRGSLERAAYGRFSYKGKGYVAHRFSWMLYNEKKIPKGMYICHHCDNKPCVNPNHLFLGTPKDNTLDKLSKKRGNFPSGENHWNSKLTEKQVLKIKILYESGKMNQVQISKKFKVTQQMISYIIRKHSWKIQNKDFIIPNRKYVYKKKNRKQRSDKIID